MGGDAAAVTSHEASASHLYNGTAGTLSPGHGFGVSPLMALRYPDPAGIDNSGRSQLYPSTREPLEVSQDFFPTEGFQYIRERTLCQSNDRPNHADEQTSESVSLVAHPGSLVPFAAGSS